MDKYYQILQIPKTATQQEIKKSYRRLAMIHHPDKGGDIDKFKEIKQAYEILSNPQPKNVPFSLFGSLFDIFNNVSRSMRKLPPQVIRYPVSLEDVCKRTVVQIELVRDRICSCSKQVKLACPTCRGSGCMKCSRLGFIPPQGCHNCNRGITRSVKTLNLHLSPIMVSRKYVFHNEGNEYFNKDPADCYIYVDIKPHTTFNIDQQYKLHHTCRISLKESLCGYTRSIKHPSGSTITFGFSGIIIPGSIERIPNQGFYPGSDLFIHHAINYPKLTSDQIKKLSEIL